MDQKKQKKVEIKQGASAVRELLMGEDINHKIKQEKKKAYELKKTSQIKLKDYSDDEDFDEEDFGKNDMVRELGHENSQYI